MFARAYASMQTRWEDYLSRRPHRSFRLTRRRDIPKPVKLPGYLSFTSLVFRTLWQNKRLFCSFVVLHMLLATLLVGIAQQSQYATLVTSLKEVGPDLVGGSFDGLTQTAALFGVAITGGLNPPTDQAGQLNLVLLGLFSWLTIIWLLRHVLAGSTVKLRDGLYNAGAPFVATIIIAFIGAIQLLPAALGIIAYTAATSGGILLGGVESMAFALAMVLLSVLSLYWVTSTFLAGIIVTLPGTYPMTALKNAGDLAFGRRSALVLRLLWLMVMIVLIWLVILVPILLIDSALSVSWLPLVPVTVQLLGAVSVLYGTAYIYLIYRKMIDEPA